jgi:uncharacterized protein (TIGR03032 family)
MNNQIKPGNQLAPFSCSYTPQLPELLYNLKCSIAVSTYQACKMIFLSPKDENYLVQLPRNFNKPMGFSFNSNYSKMALACRDEVVVFTESAELASHYPKSPSTYDAMYVPRVTYHTSALDLHDLQFGVNEELFAVNTLFSCIVKIDGNYNFTPVWSPKQITELVSEDRCHLNGMAMLDGKPKYVSAFNEGNTASSWREDITTSGVIWDVESNEVIAKGLPMPHSPKLFNGQLYVLLSATGEVVKVDVKSGKYDVVTKIEGFVRGMSLHQDYLFVATSKLRKNSSTFAKLPFAEKANKCSIVAVHLPTGSIAGNITYSTSVDEIYDVHVIPGKIRPNILNTQSEDHKGAIIIPGATFWAGLNKENE